MKRLVLLVWLVAAVLATADAAAQADADRRGWIGVMLGGDEAEAGTSRGVPLFGIVAGSPAEAAGLRARDVIVAVDGTPVGDPGELIARVRRFDPDERISLTVRRDGREREIRLRLAERPGRDEAVELRDGWVGLSAIELPPALREHFGASPDSGVMVSDVLPGSPAERAGIELGDVLVAIDGLPVADSGALDGRIRRGGIGNALELTLFRRGEELRTEVEVREEPPPEELVTEPRDGASPDG